MGDKTPGPRIENRVASKYFTPCRTLGLKRKSTPKSDILKKIRPENKSSLLIDKSDENSPLNSSKVNDTRLNLLSPSPSNDGGNNWSPLKINHIKSSQLVKDIRKKCPSTQLDSCKTKCLVKTDCLSTPVRYSKQKVVQSEHSEELEVKIVEQIKRINGKVSQIDKLKQDQVYSKKHNLTDLKQSTDKWLSGFKRITVDLHSELQARGKVCTLLDVLVDHNISPERVGFNVEDLDFD